jgi:hypothetical protein
VLSVLSDTVVTTTANPVTINVLANDSGSNLRITSFSNPANGSLVFNNDKSFTYTPAVGFIGEDGFSYTVRDEQGTPGSAMVMISVVPDDGAIVATNDFVEVVSGGEIIVPVLANDMVPEGGSLRISAVSVPGYGAVNVLSDQTIRYVPQGGFVGIDSFTYTITDELEATSTATVTVKVVATNNDPLATNDNFAVEAGQTTLLAVLANDSDPDGGPLEIVGFTMPSHGTLTFNPDKTFTYTPNENYLGSDQFTYTVRDARGANASANVFLTIVATSESPTAIDDQFTTTTGLPVTIDVLDNDTLPAEQEVNIIAVTLPFKGQLTFNADKTITYTPSAGFVGTDDFTYTIGNGKGDTSKATVMIEVTPAVVNDVYPNGYGFRRRIVIPASSAKGGSHENFPLWVDLGSNRLRSTANGGHVANAAGHDLRFELDDGTKLAHELERYDSTSGNLGAWVRVPQLQGDTETSLFLYYGNSEVAESEAAPQAVWQDYLAVWHLPDSTDVADVSRSLTAAGTVADTNDGLGVGSLALNGNGVLTLADTSWLQGLSALSIQLRSRANNIGHDKGQLGVGSTLFTNQDGDIVIRYQSIGYASIQPRNLLHTSITTNAGKLRTSSPSDTQTINWQSIVLAWQSGDSENNLYLDGKKIDPSFTTSISGAATTQIEGPLYIGASSRDSENGGWAGLIDELRFRPSKLTASWIAAEHLNHDTPTLFYGLGDEETINELQPSIVALPLDVQTPSGTWIEIDVLSAAQIPAGSPDATIQAVSQPANGTAAVINEFVRYSPAASFVGEDSFTFTLAAQGKTSTAHVRVKVEATASQGQGGSEANANYLRTVDVANASQLTTALSNARPGDDIVLANGTYSGNFTLSTSGTTDNPIRIRASTQHGATMTGRIVLSGSHTRVRDLRWGASPTSGDSVVEIDGNFVKAQGCLFDGARVSNGAQRGIIRVNVGNDSTVEYNEIRNFEGRGICVRANTSGAFRALVRRNYVHTPVSGGGFGTLAIGVGGDSDLIGPVTKASNAIIEYNLVEGMGGGYGGVIQSKTSNVIIRFNTGRNNYARMEVREGRFCDVIANACINTLGPVCHGEDHRLIGNFNDGAQSGNWHDMGPMGGVADMLTVTNPNNTNFQKQAYAIRTLCAGNIGILRLGGGTSSWLPARDTIVEAHNGSVVTQNAVNTTYRDLTVTVPPYIVLQPSDVGPNAIS